MNFPLFDKPGVLAPLQELFNWLTVSTPQQEPVRAIANRRASRMAFHTREHKAPLARPDSQKQTQTQAGAHKPLRIVRILDADHAPANVGRMLISGRMADVCAELDRLATREAALH
jgi:hypothetical protein